MPPPAVTRTVEPDAARASIYRDKFAQYLRFSETLRAYARVPLNNRTGR